MNQYYITAIRPFIDKYSSSMKVFDSAIWSVNETKKAAKLYYNIQDQLIKDILHIIAEAKIEELELLDSRSFMSMGNDCKYEVYQSDIDKRIALIKQEIE